MGEIIFLPDRKPHLQHQKIKKSSRVISFIEGKQALERLNQLAVLERVTRKYGTGILHGETFYRRTSVMGNGRRERVKLSFIATQLRRIQKERMKIRRQL